VMPQSGADDRMVEVLISLYANCPAGTGIQFHLFASPHIRPQLRRYANLRMEDADQLSKAQRWGRPARNDNLFRVLARRRFDNLPSALPFIKDGRLVPIIVAAPQRLAALPNVPTFAEIGLSPVNRMAYYGIHGPANIPKDMVDKIHAAVKKTVEMPDVKKRIEDTGSIIIANTPAEFSKQIRDELVTYKKVVQLQRLKLD
jgi:hypothetical protein